MIDTKRHRTIIRDFNAGASLKQAVKRASFYDISKEETVAVFKAICRKYGYSGTVPSPPSKRPALVGFVDIGGGLLYNETSNLYHKDGVTRDETSAEWAGWVGHGATLKGLIKNNLK